MDSLITLKFISSPISYPEQLLNLDIRDSQKTPRPSLYLSSFHSQGYPKMENQSLQIWSGQETESFEEDPYLFSAHLSPLDSSGYYTPLNWKWDLEFPFSGSLFDSMPTYPSMKSLPTNGENFLSEYGKDFGGCDDTGATGKNEIMKEIVLYGNSNSEGGEDLKKGEEKRTERDQQANGSSDLTREAITSYFYMPITQAAKELNIGLTVLKKRCREVGIMRWPHRKLMSLQTLIMNIQELREEGEESEAHMREAVELLEKERKLMEQMPDLQLEEKTKKLRQACFKANYKKRRLIEGVDLGSSQKQSAALCNTSSLMFF